MSYDSSTGQYFHNEAEEMDADLASDDCQRIRNAMEDFFGVLHTLRPFIRNYEEFHCMLEEQMVDAVYPAYSKLQALANEDRPKPFPTSDVLRKRTAVMTVIRRVMKEDEAKAAALIAEAL